VTQPEAKLLLAEVHLHSSGYQEKAVQELQELLGSEPNNPAALRDLGYAFLEKRDTNHAVEFLHRAIQANSKDARVHYYYAMLLYQQQGRSTDQEAELKKELESAISLDPTLADAQSLLAFSRMTAGDKVGAMNAAQTAVGLSPRNEWYQLNLAEIYVGAGRVGDGIAILKRLQNSGDPQVAAQSAERLSSALMYQQQVEMVARENAAGSQMMTVSSASQPSPPNSVEDPTVVTIKTAMPSKYLKGMLKIVDCSSRPAASISVVSAARIWTLRVKDTRNVVVIGADEFSCSWTNQKVGVNFRQTGEAQGDVISIEIE
jgi:tetratricopeptide (TPR) repeat protein